MPHRRHLKPSSECKKQMFFSLFRKQKIKSSDIPVRIMDVAVVGGNNVEIEHPTFSVNNPKGMLRFFAAGKSPFLPSQSHWLITKLTQLVTYNGRAEWMEPHKTAGLLPSRTWTGVLFSRRHEYKPTQRHAEPIKFVCGYLVSHLG